LGAAFAAPSDDFKAANQLYNAGKFAEAAAAYEKIEPKTAYVYYNLGNAFFARASWVSRFSTMSGPGDWRHAIRTFSRIFDLPNSGWVWTK